MFFIFTGILDLIVISLMAFFHFFQITAIFIFWIVLFLLQRYLQWEWLLSYVQCYQCLEAATQRCYYEKVFWKFQKMYRRTSMSKSDLNKVAKQLWWNPTSAWLVSCELAAYFQNNFSKEDLWVAASKCYCSMIV